MKTVHPTQHARAVVLFAVFAATFFTFAHNVRQLETDAAATTASLLDQASALETLRVEQAR